MTRRLHFLEQCVGALVFAAQSQPQLSQVLGLS